MQAPIPKKADQFFSFGPYRLHLGGELYKGANPVPLPPKSSDVLVALVSRQGRLATKDELMSEVWADTFVEDSSLAYQISQLRKALGERPDGRPYIETVPKRGYRFAATATQSWNHPSSSVNTQVDSVDKQSAGAGPRRVWMRWAGALVAMLLIGVLVGARLFGPAKQTPLRKFEISPPVMLSIAQGVHPNVAISPDGARIAYVAFDDRRLWVHDLEKGSSRPIYGTEGADDPFWSPHSDRIAYFAGPQIRTIEPEGGSSWLVYQKKGSIDGEYIDGRLRGGAWSLDAESIVFSNEGSLYESPGSRRGSEVAGVSDANGRLYRSDSLAKFPAGENRESHPGLYLRR